MAFGRVVKLYVGKFELGNEAEEAVGGDNLLIENLDIEFEVERSIYYWENGATITVWNASPGTIKTIMVSRSVVLKAGYEDEGVGNIFVGQIGLVRNERARGGDMRTTLSCVSARGAFYQLSKLSCDCRFSATDTARACLQTLCDYAGLALRASGEDLDTAIGAPFACSDSFPNAVKAFSDGVLFPLVHKKLYMDNNEMIVYGLGTSGKFDRISLEEIDLDFESGLLSCTEIKDERDNRINAAQNAYYFFEGLPNSSVIEEYGLKPDELPEEDLDMKRRIRFTALISPRFAPNVFVNMDSRTGDEYDEVLAVEGRFIILSVTFRGGNTGSDFTVDCEALEAEDDG